jgi:hypothetical protein
VSELSATPIVQDRPAPAEQVAQLRAIRALVEELAGTQAGGAFESADDLDRRYDAASPIAQRHFDALAGEITAYAAAGLSALITGRSSGGDVQGAAAHLAREMERSIRRMEGLI